MSLIPDFTPLINQIKEFNLNQTRTNQLLEQLLEISKDIKNALNHPK